jgi:hypothetical protein
MPSRGCPRNHPTVWRTGISSRIVTNACANLPWSTSNGSLELGHPPSPSGPAILAAARPSGELPAPRAYRAPRARPTPRRRTALLCLSRLTGRIHIDRLISSAPDENDRMIRRCPAPSSCSTSSPQSHRPAPCRSGWPGSRRGRRGTALKGRAGRQWTSSPAIIALLSSGGWVAAISGHRLRPRAPAAAGDDSRGGPKRRGRRADAAGESAAGWRGSGRAERGG